MKTRLLFLVACLPALALPSLLAAPAPTATPSFDWPQWRGPERNDISKENDLLKEWPNGGPTLLWNSDEGGNGYAGPAVVGDRYYTMGADEKSEYVLCLDVANGKQVWRRDYGTRFKNANWGDGPRCTPTIDGDLLYGIGGQGDIVCAKIADGTIVWEKNMKKDLAGQQMSGWGYTESPLIDGELMVCTPGGDKGAVAALDKKTGDVKWRSKEFTDKAGYSSLVIGNCGGIKQYVQMTGDSVAGIAANDGRLLWRFPCSNKTAAIPTPIVDGDLVYSTSGYGAGCRLVKVTAGSGKETEKADEVYADKAMTNHHGGVVKVGDHLYGYSDNGGAWICQDFKTGKVVWSEKKLGKGSVTCAGGMLYLYSEGKGECVLIDASPAGWKEHGRFTIPKTAKRPSGAGIRTHPVVANGRLYLRDQELLFAFDVRAKAGGQ
jgi:outer membrane protein assembly factor BamB